MVLQKVETKTGLNIIELVTPPKKFKYIDLDRQKRKY